MTNSIVSEVEDMIDELIDLINAKRNEISFAIKKLCDESKKQLDIDNIQNIVSNTIEFFFKYYKKAGMEELMRYRMALDCLIEER
ncbi:hypothetical protein [Peptostreptococcus canis]|uniref:Uncharacterized protein n=1 Tax=Peptostreptococcus canis TaxID=1159213 RepID=A0ABR6TMD0_9FIRM|nr:hypothetical protein [Peptostreptococcus canis]MBC2576559.1 hypothetical protein [Peptostreptococcus canis]MBP1998747.1 hypothetical protein [Peptostreptococcus canis]